MSAASIDDLLLTDEEIASLDAEQLNAYAATLSRAQANIDRLSWRERARPEQLPPDEPWTVLFLGGGRGSGKTWASARIFLDEIENDPLRDSEGPGDWAIVAPTFSEARDKCVEGEAGILAALGTNRAEVDAGRSERVAKWNRSNSAGELLLRDGTRIMIDGANDGAPSVNGENLRGCWASEIGFWRQWERAWDESIGFAVRKGRARIIADGTPKRIMPARRLIKRLLNDPNVICRRLRTWDNLDNLSPAFVERVREHEGTQLGKQELEGFLLDDIEGALWRSEWFDRPDFRATEVPPGGWQGTPRTGVDPADGTESGAEHAYTTAGLAGDHRIYVTAHEGMTCSPYEFACAVVKHSHAAHSVIILEKNHGGAWLVEVFRRAMSDLNMHRPPQVIHASQGKLTRAEPVAALYEPRHVNGEILPGRVRHMGVFPELEDQLSGWSGAPGEPSPDRLDSLVWALSGFVGSSFKPQPSESQAGVVRFAEQQFAGTGGAVPYSYGGNPLDSWDPISLQPR